LETDQPAGPVVAEEEEEDPLAGLFEQPAAAVAVPAKKKGRLGRLLGRGKKDKAEQPARLETDEPGGWVLPGEEDEEADVRVVAEKPWDEDGGTFEAAEAQPAADDGWGASRSSGWMTSDSEALSEFTANVVEVGTEDAGETAEAA